LARPGVRVDAAPVVGLTVGIQRLLIRPQIDWHVLEIDPDSRPRTVAPAHRIDEHVRRLEMRCGFRVTPAPPLQPGENILLLPRAPDLDQRVLRGPSPRGLYTRRLARLLFVLGRPGSVSQPVALVAR
jgi:hypothetical protein